MLRIKHGSLKWVTLLSAFGAFTMVHVDAACERLELLKIREFDVCEILNESKARVSADKLAIEGVPSDYKI